MAPKKKADVEAPRGKRTSAAAFSALDLLRGLVSRGSAAAAEPSSPPPAKKNKPSSSGTPAQAKKPQPPPKKKAAPPSKPLPAPTPNVAGRPKPTAQRERQDKPSAGDAVRVWWPPTRDPAKTGFSGAYWPARALAGPSGGAAGSEWLTVKYDNGSTARALLDDLFPADPPVAFGGERVALKPGEFVEVHNGSASDPAAWVAVARKVVAGSGCGGKDGGGSSKKEQGAGGAGGGSVVVSYPFHDTADETVPASRVRRARVWELGAWMLPKPGQRWQPGDVTSPRELELLTEREYFKRLSSGGGGGGGGGGQAAAANGGGGSKKVAKAPPVKPLKKTKPAAKTAPGKGGGGLKKKN